MNITLENRTHISDLPEDDRLPAVCLAIQYIEGFLAMIGNSLILVAFVKFQDLRSPTNWLVLNMAINDVMSFFCCTAECGPTI